MSITNSFPSCRFTASSALCCLLLCLAILTPAPTLAQRQAFTSNSQGYGGAFIPNSNSNGQAPRPEDVMHVGHNWAAIEQNELPVTTSTAPLTPPLENENHPEYAHSIGEDYNPERVLITYKHGQRSRVQNIIAAARWTSLDGSEKQGKIFRVFPGRGKHVLSAEVHFEAQRFLLRSGLAVAIEVDQPRYLFLAHDRLPEQPSHSPTQPEEIPPQSMDGVFQNATSRQDLQSSVTNSGGKKTITICLIGAGYACGHEDLPPCTPSHDGSYPVTGATSSASSEPWNSAAHDHGTHTAGTVAAIGGNNLGVVGVIDGAMVDGKRFSLHNHRLFDRGDRVVRVSDLIAALDDCKAHQADIVSMSLGGFAPSKLEQKVLKQMSEDDGILFVAAAGDTGDAQLSYPASYPYVMSVTAVDAQHQNIAPYSSHNDMVDVAAPGDYILSTLPSGYGYLSGTGMATAHVSAAAGLLWARHKMATNQQIRAALQETSQDMGPVGWDVMYGHGIVQVEAADRHLLQICTACKLVCPPFSCGSNANCFMDPVRRSPVCSCPAGFEMDHNTADCVDIDECIIGDSREDTSTRTQTIQMPLPVSTNPCDPDEGFCINRAGGFDCIPCLPVPNCEKLQGCVNPVESKCQLCSAGFALTPDGRCVDINECLPTSPVQAQCALVATCQNVPGAYLCDCPAGMSGDGLGPSGCREVDCPRNSAGLNVRDGCLCLPGFLGVISPSTLPPFHSGSCDQPLILRQTESPASPPHTSTMSSSTLPPTRGLDTTSPQPAACGVFGVSCGVARDCCSGSCVNKKCTSTQPAQSSCSTPGGVDSDRDGVCDMDDLCNGSDDLLDANHNGVPDGCDPCVLFPCAPGQLCVVQSDGLSTERQCVVPPETAYAHALAARLKVSCEQLPSEQARQTMLAQVADGLDIPTSRLNLAAAASATSATSGRSYPARATYTLTFLPIVPRDAQRGSDSQQQAMQVHKDSREGRDLALGDAIYPARLLRKFQTQLATGVYNHASWAHVLDHFYLDQQLVLLCTDNQQWSSDCEKNAMLQSQHSASALHSMPADKLALYVVIGVLVLCVALLSVKLVGSRRRFNRVHVQGAPGSSPPCSPAKTVSRAEGEVLTKDFSQVAQDIHDASFSAEGIPRGIIPRRDFDKPTAPIPAPRFE
eukprot:g9784.t1